MAERCPLPGAEDLQGSEVAKAAEAEEPIIPSGVNVISGSKWKAKRPVESDKQIKWKFPATTHSPLEQLGEMFRRLEIKGVVLPGAAAAVAGTGGVKSLTTCLLPS